MFNVGVGEMLVIAVVALLVFGPNRLPEIMRNIGKGLRAFQVETQRATAMLKQGLEETQAGIGPGVVDIPDAGTPDVIPSPPPDPARAVPAREHEDT